MSGRYFEFNEMSRNKTGRQTPYKLTHLPIHKIHIDKYYKKQNWEFQKVLLPQASLRGAGYKERQEVIRGVNRIWKWGLWSIFSLAEREREREGPINTENPN